MLLLTINSQSLCQGKTCAKMAEIHAEYDRKEMHLPDKTSGIACYRNSVSKLLGSFQVCQFTMAIGFNAEGEMALGKIADAYHHPNSDHLA